MTAPDLPAPQNAAVPVRATDAEQSSASTRAKAANDAAGWVEAGTGEDGPPSHTVKAKLKSGIYHLPGMLNYDRTIPDRWYTDAAAAEADGLRKAKR